MIRRSEIPAEDPQMKSEKWKGFRMLRSVLCVAVYLIIKPVSVFSQNTPEPPAGVIMAARSSFNEYAAGPGLSYILSTTNTPDQQITISRAFDPTPGGSVSPLGPSYPFPDLARMVYNSDFAGTVTLLNSWSYLTKGNSFVTTVYLARVSDATISDNNMIGRNQNIYIVRAGGLLTYKGHLVSGVDPNFAPFHIGEQLFLFGRRLTNNAYKVDANGSLIVQGGSIHDSNLSQTHHSPFRGRSLDSIRAETFATWQTQPLKQGRVR